MTPSLLCLPALCFVALLFFSHKSFFKALVSFVFDKVHKILEYLIDLAHPVEFFTPRIDPPFPCSLMFISTICSYLLYQRRPDCQLLWFVALQTRLSVTGEMSLLYIKQFVCLGKSIFIVFPLIHFRISTSSLFFVSDAQHL